MKRALSEHPCYCESAHLEFARMHIPVAPRCNIQCNYCNRKFDCCNESRPGVTSEVLSAEDALVKIGAVRAKIPQLRVIGIAGPGDPLANDETFRTLELVSREYPDLTLCVSTNGLALPESADRLHGLGVRFITVTMNAVDPEIGAQVYGSVRLDGETLTGTDAASALISRQLEGIGRCVSLDMVVKVNIVMIPGINDRHIPDVVRKVRSLGAYIVNILPLIPVEGTPFADRRAPTPLERRELMDLCSIDARMMRHCRQCRADAIGLLGEDRSSEFVNFRGCGSGCGPKDGLNVTLDTGSERPYTAVATSDGTSVDSGFGNARSFRVYAVRDGSAELVATRDVPPHGTVAGDGHRKHIEGIVELLSDCGRVVVREIGPLPGKVLANVGIEVVVAEGDVSSILKDGPRPWAPLNP